MQKRHEPLLLFFSFLFFLVVTGVRSGRIEVWRPREAARLVAAYIDVRARVAEFGRYLTLLLRQQWGEVLDK